MTDQPDHELEVLEEDQSVPPRPEEAVADADRSREDEGTATPVGDGARPRTKREQTRS